MRWSGRRRWWWWRRKFRDLSRDIHPNGDGNLCLRLYHIDAQSEADAHGQLTEIDIFDGQ